MLKTAALCTMGCKVNSYESQGMKELLENAGYTIVPFDTKADLYLINTCTVTQIAARKSRQMIHRARSLNQDALVIAAGCYVDRDDSLIKEGVIDLAVPNRRKAELIDIIDAFMAQRLVPEAITGEENVPDTTEDLKLPCQEEAEKELSITKSEGRTRAFLKIQDGCRQFCTYCIIPYVRGPLKSRPIADCVHEAALLAAQGFQEVVLTGIHVTSYGQDWAMAKEKDPSVNVPEGDLGDLILAISKIDGIERIRLSSLEPRLITSEFLAKVAETSKLCPHFHLALQSGCDKTLKAMNRKYTSADFGRAAAMLREQYPDVALTTDIIVGFPGETEEDHAQSLQFVREIGFAEAHIFRYSPMQGTVAQKRKDQVDGQVKNRRSDEMLDVTRQSTLSFMQKMQGKVCEIILEELDEDGYWTGYSPNYMRIAVKDFGGAFSGQKVKVKVDGYVEKRSANHDASGVDTILKGVYGYE